LRATLDRHLAPQTASHLTD